MIALPALDSSRFRAEEVAGEGVPEGEDDMRVSDENEGDERARGGRTDKDGSHN